MKKPIVALLTFLLLMPAEKSLRAQQFRRIIVSYSIRLPQAYPSSLPAPLPQNISSITPGIRLRYDSLLSAYKTRISDLEKQPAGVQRDTMVMGYLHDQIVVQSFIENYDMVQAYNQGKQPSPSLAILPLAQKLRAMAIQANHAYYTWAGFIWEEMTLYTSGDITKSFEVAFKRAQLCDSCTDCGQAPECYIALAQYYSEFNDTVNTDLYFTKALNSVTETSSKVFTLREWAVVCNKQHLPAKALHTIGRLYAIDKTPFDESWVLRQKALAQVQLQQFDSALATANKALEDERATMGQTGSLNGRALQEYMPDSYLALLARVYLGLHQPLKAWGYANNPNLWDDIEDTPDELLYEVHKAMGNYAKALQYYEQFVAFKDEQGRSNKKNLLAIMQRKYEVQKVQNVADEEKLRSQSLLKTRAYLIAGLALLGLFLFILTRTIRQKQRANNLLNTQKQEISFERIKAEQALVELQAAQKELVQKEKMASLGELTAGIAHEIQNPLNFVNNFSEVTREMVDELVSEKAKLAGEKDEQLEDELLADIKQNLEKINHHGKRADAIVKGMLQHSRKSTGTKEPTNINALADEYLRLAYHGLRAKDAAFNATLNTDFDESIGKINIIPQDMGRVLLNLYNNAFYAVTEKKKKESPYPPSEPARAALKEGEAYQPTVTVSTKLISAPLGAGGLVSITVSDNGNGIPQKIVDKIFQPFFTTKPTGQGTGLGLSLSYDIIKAHGGEIKVETNEGEGTRFIIQLSIEK